MHTKCDGHTCKFKQITLHSYYHHRCILTGCLSTEHGNDKYLFRVHSALPQKLSRRFPFVSRQSWEPLKISLSAIGSFLVSWVISSKPTYKNKMSDTLLGIHATKCQLQSKLNFSYLIPTTKSQLNVRYHT